MSVLRISLIAFLLGCGGAAPEVADPIESNEPTTMESAIDPPESTEPAASPPPADGPVEWRMEQVSPGPGGPWDYGRLGPGPAVTIALTPIGGGDAMLGTRSEGEWRFSPLGMNLSVSRLWQDSAMARELDVMGDSSQLRLIRADGTVVYRHDCPFTSASEDGIETDEGWLVAFRCGERSTEVGRVGRDGSWRPVGTLAGVFGVEAGTDALAFFRRDGETLAIDVLPVDATSLDALERSPTTPTRPSLAPTMLVDDERRVHLFEREGNQTVWRHPGGSRPLPDFLEVGATLDEAGRPVLVGRDANEELTVWWWLGEAWREEALEPPADSDFWVRGMRAPPSPPPAFSSPRSSARA